MKKLSVIFLLLYTSTAFGQLSVNHLGLNLNFNSSYRVNNNFMSAFFEMPETDAPAGGNSVSINRVMSDYKLGFNTTKYKYLQFEINVLQGVEYADFSDFQYNLNDSIYSQGLNTNLESSVIGLRTMAKVSTDMSKRFMFNFGLGLEGLFTYDVSKEGYLRTDTRVSGNSERRYLTYKDRTNYASINLAQQAGMSFRLGKDESKHPFDKVMVETNFQIISNFTVASELYRHRTYGGIIGITYEFR